MFMETRQVYAAARSHVKPQRQNEKAQMKEERNSEIK